MILSNGLKKRKKYASPGRLGNSQGESVVNKTFKDSLDISLSVDSVINNTNNEFGIYQKYIKELIDIANLYKKEYEYCNTYSSWGLVENFNIQYYRKGGGYKTFHCERYGATEKNNTRVLAWMTYLNDVTDQGETEFYYQDIKVKPKKGLTLIWPQLSGHIHIGVYHLKPRKNILLLDGSIF